MVAKLLTTMFLVIFIGGVVNASAFYEVDRCQWQSVLLGKFFTGETARKNKIVLQNMLERNPDRAPGFRLDEVDSDNKIDKKYFGYAKIGSDYELHVKVFTREYEILVVGKVVQKIDGKLKEILKGSSYNSNYGFDEQVSRSLSLGFVLTDSVTNDEFENISNEDFQKNNRFDSPVLSEVYLGCTAQKATE